MFNNVSVMFAAVPSAARRVSCLLFILITCPWEICCNCLSQRPLLFCQNLAGISQKAGNLPDSERSLTDSHASCSSFISLQNSAKKCIIAFTLNFRLAPSKDGLNKKNIKKNPPQNVPMEFFPKKIEILEHSTKNTLNISFWSQGLPGSRGSSFLGR